MLEISRDGPFFAMGARAERMPMHVVTRVLGLAALSLSIQGFTQGPGSDTTTSQSQLAVQRQAEERAQKQFENIIQLGTLAFAGIAAAGAVAAWWANKRSADAAEAQIALMKDEITNSRGDADEQRRIALQGLAETRNTALAATRSAELSRDALYLLEGANVQLEESIFDVPAHASSELDAIWNSVLTLKWRNYGRSAAKNFVADVNLGILGMSIEEDAKRQPEVVIAPDQTISHGFGRLGDLLPPDAINLVALGGMPLTYWGTASYIDVFGRRTTLEVRAEWVRGTTAFKNTHHAETRTPPEETHN
jgi:hypothetical protein